MNQRLSFSGHESFICKHFWLKKGFDYVVKGGNFNKEEDAVVTLGVGKNMVSAIQYWLRAFGIVDSTSGKPTELGNFIFAQNGVDPYVEDIATLWLLHYSLVKTGRASMYSLFFNEFRKSRFEFTKDQLASFVKRKLETLEQKNFTAHTLNTDIGVFIRTYLRPDARGNKIDIEDDFSNLLIDLEIMESYQSENAEGKSVDWYKLDSKVRDEIPFQLLLFAILDNETYGKSISFREILTGYNSPGSIFTINDDCLYNKVKEIANKYKGITYTESAGVRELQFKVKPNKWAILNEYYQQ